MNKVAIISTIQPETHYTRYLYRELKKVNSNVYLLVDDIAENDDFVAAQKDSHILKVWRPGWSMLFTISKFVRSNNISVVHLQHEFNMYGGVKGIPIFLILILMLRLKGVKVIVTTHAVVDYKIIDNGFLDTFALNRFKKIKGIVRFIFYIFYKSLAIIADKVVVHSKFTKQNFIDAYKIKESKCFVIPIGIDKISRQIEGDTDQGVEPDWVERVKKKKIILYFGYILKRKGIELLIEAVETLQSDIPGTVLVLAGGILENQKEYANSLKDIVSKKRLTEKIIFTGFLSEKEIVFLYGKCDFVVLPYTHSISSSLPLSLAFESGKPVIASDIGTLRDEIEENVNGLFFKNGNAKELTKKIKLLSTDTRLMEQLRLGVKNASKERSWARVAQLTNELVYASKEQI